ncbi:hypothetical protein GCM10023187_25110 [Nibrella viscosa]|uniref:NAD-dependent epimerase/dehydratase domain-containing protein n=2 Tax=Nibrella viscosa TaxID=1084524 RepID=A0ABP8KGV3_9BACT
MVIHLAARAGVRPSVENPSLYVDVNVNGTLTLLEAMRQAQVTKIVMASSSSVYGNSSTIPFTEADACDRPLSAYAASKRAAELLAHTYYHLHGFDITCLRFFTVYGPRQRPEMAISQFTASISNGYPITLYGDGSTARDYTYVTDIVSGVLAAIKNLGGFNIYNIGGSAPVTLLSLIQHIEKGLGSKAVINWQPMQPGDVEQTYADLSLARKLLHYEPTISIEKGIEQYIIWFHQNNTLTML